jgi:hypothetical protein
VAPDQRFIAPTFSDTEKDPESAIVTENVRKQLLLEGDPSPSRGQTAAPVTVVEFGDFQCPYCRTLDCGCVRFLKSSQTTRALSISTFRSQLIRGRVQRLTLPLALKENPRQRFGLCTTRFIVSRT